MRHFWKAVQGTICAVLLFGLAASADTLQLKNGDVVQGKYLGGSERAVQFEVNGKTELYETSRILSITFTGERSAESVPAGPADRDEKVASAGPDQGRPTLPAGTHVMVRMIDSVDSETNHVGDRFRASLESDLTVDGVVIAPKGADVYGRLANAEEAGHLSGKAQLKLELTDILIHDRMQPIVTGDYDVAGKGRGENTAEKTVGGAAIGAIIGAIAGGGKGAAIGAGVGGGAGAAVNVVTRGEQVRVPSETVLDFRLEQPFAPHLE